MNARRKMAALLAATLVSVLTLTASAQGAATVEGGEPLPSGQSGLIITPESFSYPDAVLGEPISDSITIENPGSTVTITDLATAGTNAGDITIGAETCTGGPLDQDETCVIPFTYVAEAAGSREAAISFTVPTVSTESVLFSAQVSYPENDAIFYTERQAGPAYTWNGGNAFARTVQSGTQRLHLLYATDRIGGEWATNSGPKVGIYYIRGSTGTTASWSTGKRLNPKDQHATILGLAAAGSKVYAMWVSQTKWVNYNPDAPRVLYVRVNKKHGLKDEWRATKRLTSTTGRVDYPVIAATGTDVHIAYTNGNNGYVYVASSRDQGVTWTKTHVGTTLIELSDGMSGFPAIAANGSTVVACWLTDVSGLMDCRVSTNRGVSWGGTTTVGAESTGYFSVAVRGSRIAVAWTTPDALVLRQRIDGTWDDVAVVPTDEIAVTGQEVLDRYGPVVMLQDDDRVGVGWASEYEFSTNLFWAESADGGAIWHEAAWLSELLRNDWPSVVWHTAETRYVVWNSWNENTFEYELYLSRGDGTTSASTTGGAVATPWVSGGRKVTVRDSKAAGTAANAR